MAPLISRAQQMATWKRSMAFSLREETFEKRRGNGGSGHEVEERDTTSNPLSSLLDFALERLFSPSDIFSGHSRTKRVPISQAKAVSKPVKTAGTTYETGPQSAPKSAPHATSISLPHSSSISPPLQSNPPGKPSPSLSPPPPEKHTISSRNQGIGAGVGSAAAIGLLIVLFLLLRRYCRQGWSTKPSRRFNKGKRRDDEAHPGMKHLTFEQRRKIEEAHPRKYANRARESRTGEGIMMVRPTQTERRDFGSQFSPSLESQLQRTGTEDQEAGGSEAEAETAGPSQRRPTVPDRAISSFMLPSPIVSVAETAAAFNSGDARIMCLTPSSDGGDVGRVVSLGDSCVIEALVGVMNDDDEEEEERRGDEDERRGDDGERRGGDEDHVVGIVSQERREIDGVVITVTDLGPRVVESAEEDESGGEGGVDGDGGWSPHSADLGDWVEDPAYMDRHELDSEGESDDCSFKSMRDSMEEGEPEEGGRSGDDEQREGAGRNVGAAGGVENAPWVGTASAGSEGGASGYEGDDDPYGGDVGDDASTTSWVSGC